MNNIKVFFSKEVTRSKPTLIFPGMMAGFFFSRFSGDKRKIACPLLTVLEVQGYLSTVTVQKLNGSLLAKMNIIYIVDFASESYMSLNFNVSMSVF